MLNRIICIVDLSKYMNMRHTTTKKILGDILFWATEAAGWRPASVNLGWAASRATVTDNCLTVAVTVSKPPRLILR
jgi:hypothetical protein